MKLLNNKIVAVAFMLLISLSLYGQKETRKERKEREKKEREALFELSKAVVNDSTFVIHGERVILRGGETEYVSETTNFLKISKEDGVLQVAPIFAMGPGANGLGGVTLKGRISKYEVKEKDNNIYLRVNIQGMAGTAEISVNVYGGNIATVNVSGLFSGPAFTMYGKIAPLGNQFTFEGADL